MSNSAAITSLWLYIWGLWIQLTKTAAILYWLVSSLMAAMFCGCGKMISVLSIMHPLSLRVSVSPRSHKAEGGAGLGHGRLRVPSEGGAPLWRSAEWGPTWHHRLQRRDRHLGRGPARRTLHITTGAVAAWSHTQCKCVSEVSIDQHVVTWFLSNTPVLTISPVLQLEIKHLITLNPQVMFHQVSTKLHNI